MNEFAYLVTTGHYSDYRVHGVFLTEEDAQEVAHRYNTTELLYRDDPEMQHVVTSTQAVIEAVPIFRAGDHPVLYHNGYIGGASFQSAAEYLAAAPESQSGD